MSEGVSEPACGGRDDSNVEPVDESQSGLLGVVEGEAGAVSDAEEPVAAAALHNDSNPNLKSTAGGSSKQFPLDAELQSTDESCEAAQVSPRMRELLDSGAAALKETATFSVTCEPLSDVANAAATNKANSKVVLFVRHGQGFHNLMREVYGEHGIGYDPSKGVELGPTNPYRLCELLDAPLTDKGRGEARSIVKQLATVSARPELIVTSPLSRATQTAVIGFRDLISAGVPIVAHEDCRERFGAHFCDYRRPVDDLMYDFPQVSYEFLDVVEDPYRGEFFDDHRERYSSVAARAYRFLEFLRARPEDAIAVVSHGSFLYVLFNAILESEASTSPEEAFKTSELRAVRLTFVDRGSGALSESFDHSQPKDTSNHDASTSVQKAGAKQARHGELSDANEFGQDGGILNNDDDTDDLEDVGHRLAQRIETVKDLLHLNDVELGKAKRGGDKYRFGDNTRGILYRGELKRELKLLKAKMQVHLS